MAYNLELEDRIEELTGGWTDVVSKKMFGGVCYLIRGNMAFGIWQDHLIVRAGRETAERYLGEEGTRPFDVTGRPMKGWVMVDGSRWEDPEELEGWLAVGRDFALTLPAK
ncbi:MAG: TfoX/Sxy family protein [bacterium]|nr:MAG: TfoX/Sxy family protein [bacterium]